MQVQSSRCCLPRASLSFARPRASLSFDQWHVTRSLPFELGGITIDYLWHGIQVELLLKIDLITLVTRHGYT